LALKEVASQVERKIEAELPRGVLLRPERFLAGISSNHETARMVIRKTARMAAQRHLINNLKLATELGAEVILIKHSNAAKGMNEVAEEMAITTLCIGKPHLNLFNVI